MDGMIDPVYELPRSPEATTAVLPPPVPLQRALLQHASGLAGRTLVVALVMALGLLHGSRTALGSATPPSAIALPDVAAPPAPAPDWHRGRFYRPPGSTATRPDPSLRPREWRPAPRIARACHGELPPHGC